MTEDRLVGGWLLLTVAEDPGGTGAARLRQRLLESSDGHRCLVLDLAAVDGSTPPAWACSSAH